MSRRGLLAKISEKAAVQDQQRREKDCVGPQKLATDHHLLVEAHEQGEKKKGHKSESAKEAERLRPPNSLFYKLYPQNEKDDATEKARRYWARINGDEDEDDAPLASDEAMHGAFTALKFLHGDGRVAASASSAPAPSGTPIASVVAPQTAAPAAPATAHAPADGAALDDAEALKRKLLEALNPEAFGGAMPASQDLREGATVNIFGLKGAPELNGQRGMLQSFDSAAGRWQVDVQGAGLKKIKPDNLQVVEGADAKRARTDGGDETTFL